ncbi:MAG: DUF4919 domain-containing protein [Alistipes sp.]|nr:DUF4919 domain-containing protein [Alistipes sp.]
MRYVTTLLLLLCVAVSASAASRIEEPNPLVANTTEREIRVPDEEDIIHQTVSVSSPYYYTNLMLKYINGTSPLSELEYYYLYYGYLYDDNYKPFNENVALDKMLMIVSAINPDQPTVMQLEALVENGLAAMEVDPFNPKVLNIMAYAYGALGDTTREQLYFNHLNGILSTIESSGTGLKEEERWHVLMFSHAYDLLASKGYDYDENRIISRDAMFIPIAQRPKERIKGFYFDYGRIYRNKPDNVTFKRDRTWQFNNLKPREYK